MAVRRGRTMFGFGRVDKKGVEEARPDGEGQKGWSLGGLESVVSWGIDDERMQGSEMSKTGRRVTACKGGQTQEKEDPDGQRRTGEERRGERGRKRKIKEAERRAANAVEEALESCSSGRRPKAA